MIGLMYAAALIAILPLILIVIHLLRLGGSSIERRLLHADAERRPVKPAAGWPTLLSAR